MGNSDQFQSEGTARLTIYDEVPYSGFSHSASHPDQISTVAFLHGLDPPSPRSCRVLELGCGSGESLIGIGFALPDTSLHGIDLAPTAIARARGTAQRLGLDNVAFEVCDLRDLRAASLGEFDYVIAHGVYTWVNQETRDALLSVCDEHLAPDGLAYISFNTHPGGHFRRALRELAIWYAGDTREATEIAERGRELFGTLSELRSDADAWGALVASELPALARASTDFLVHDLLSEDWGPVWFAEFAGAAAGHGLQYVGEASFHRVSGPWEPRVEEGLRRLSGGDRVAYEQIVDFLVWRRFRDSILCRAGRTVAETIERGRMTRLRFRPAGPLGGLGVEPDAVLTTLAGLSPPPVAFDRLAAQLEVGTTELADALFDAARRGQVTMHLDPPALGTPDAERPRISTLARLQAPQERYCTTLLGGVVELEGPVIRALLELADGSRDRDQLRADLAAIGGPSLDPEQLEDILRNLAAMALVEPVRMAT
jgi:cyclopropane fatty-acyl-phospholipid synthase-like methyltransferase